MGKLKKQRHLQLLLKRGEMKRHGGCVWLNQKYSPSFWSTWCIAERWEGDWGGWRGGYKGKAAGTLPHPSCQPSSQSASARRVHMAGLELSVSQRRPLQKCCSGSLSTPAPNIHPLPPFTATTTQNPPPQILTNEPRPLSCS